MDQESSVNRIFINEFFKYETPDIKAIDHVFYSSDVEALFYNMLVDKILLDASDHFPVYADLKLN